MGGTFNPIHNGHLIQSEFIRETVNLDRIIFLPTGKTPHKKNKEILDGKLRYKMIELAIADNHYFSLSSYEIDSGKVNYTVDTVLYLNELYKDDDLYFIIGGDSLLYLESWKDFDILIREIKFIVAHRNQKDIGKIQKTIDYLNEKYKGSIIKVDTPIIDISSTDIRKRVFNNRSIKYLTPRIVEEYIVENNLYRGR